MKMFDFPNYLLFSLDCQWKKKVLLISTNVLDIWLNVAILGEWIIRERYPIHD